MIDIEQALQRVPDFDRFYTLDELLERARNVAREHPDVADYQVVGHSTDGEEIPLVRIGDGPTRVILFAFPHPNEPIGAMLVHFLLEELVTNEELRRGRTWFLLPSVDPDGTRLNEGWFAGPYTIRNYARHFYRPPSAEQVEWTFPIDYKDLHFDHPLPETRALMRAFDIARPHLAYSLHNAGFGGVYYYVSENLEDVVDEFHAIPRRRGLALSLGEAEMPWAETFAPAIYRSGSIRDAYDYHETYGDGSPGEVIQGGGSSVDYLASMDLPDGPPVSLITELPYFQCAQISDQSPTARSRRDVLLEGVAQARATTNAMKEILDRIAPEMTLDTRPYRAVSAFTEQALDSFGSKERWAREADGMDVPATVAQETDELYVGSFYRLLIASMLRRALEEQREATPSPTLDAAASDLERLLEEWAARLESGLDYEAIPIRTSVEVQYGALLAVLGSSRFGTSPR